MKQLRLACVVTVLVCAACSDNPASPRQPDVQGRSYAISDALHGSNGNPHFFWLAPMVAQPDSGLGTFEGMASPRVDLVCLESNQTSCDPDTPLASFDRDNGLEVADQQFKVDVDTHQLNPPLVATVDPDTAYTTYRLIVYTDDMTGLGGPFVLGYADIQLGENGSAVKNLSTGETIGLVDGRTLPVRFRIDAGAYEYALQEHVVAATGSSETPDTLCQTNCSVTFVSPDSTTYAFLSDNTGQNVTGAEILPGDVSTPSVLVIDERITEGSDANCADGVSLDKMHCYRYLITPDVPFNDSIRIGICPTDVPLSSFWRILKVDYAADLTPILTIPDPVDVSDFLPCTPPSGSTSLVQAAFHYAAHWLVSPLMAQTNTRVWGAMAKDLSDLFWGLDAEITPVGSTDFTAATGTVVTPTVRVDSVGPDGVTAPYDGAEVTFRITGGTGKLSLPAGEDLVSSETTNGRVTGMTVMTGSNASASIGWTIATGTNTLEATADSAVMADPATGAVHPIVFTATGTAPFTAETVAAGNWHTCALKGGDVYCWGNNAYGQLGNGTVEDAHTPVLVQRPEGVVFAAPVAAWGNAPSGLDIAHTCAKTTTDDVYCWGSNADGALGDGSPLTSYSAIPVRVPALSDVLGPVTVASYVTCTTQPSMCWGLNSNGQLGDGTYTTSSTPVAVAEPWADQLRQISAGDGHTCALTADGQAVCWGWNGLGQMGRDAVGGYQPTPAPVTGGLTFTDLDATGRHTCAVTADGVMYCWGSNNGGQLGDGTMVDRSVPTRVEDPSSGAVHWRSVSAGAYHTCGLTDAGAIYCWGTNSYGELGTGDQVFTEAPTVPVAGGFTWLQVSAGDSYTCAISAASVVYCWGWNQMGQLGDGTTTNRWLPEPVSPPGS